MADVRLLKIGSSGGFAQVTDSDLGLTAGMNFAEGASVPGGAPSAGRGKLWVRSDTPNVLVFTDDAGTDTDLGVGTVGGSGAATEVAFWSNGTDITSEAAFAYIAASNLLTLDNLQPNSATAFALNQQNANPILAITADGDVTLQSGNPGTGDGRTLTLAGLDGVSLANGGDVVVTAGNAVGVIARVGGDISLEPGAGAAGGASGSFIVNTVASVAALTVAGATGDVTIANDLTVDGGINAGTSSTPAAGDGIFASGLVVGFDAVPVADEVQVGDANFALDQNGGTIVRLNCDGGADSYQYNRTQNTHGFVIGSTQFLTISTSGVVVNSGGLVVGVGGTTPNTASIIVEHATTVPSLHLDRDSATPAVNDVVGQIFFEGENLSGGDIDYAVIDCRLENVTAASEVGNIFFWANRNGSAQQMMNIKGDEGVLINTAANSFVDFRVLGASTATHLLFCDVSSGQENIALFATAAPNWQSMNRGLFIAGVTTEPTGNPSGGCYFWFNTSDNKLKARLPNGDIIEIAGPV